MSYIYKYNSNDGGLLASGWRWNAPVDQDVVFVASEGWYKNKGGQLIGPAINVATDFSGYYRICFSSRSAGGGYWGLVARDACGRNLIDDAYFSVDPSDSWLSCEGVVRHRQGSVSVSIFFQGKTPIEIDSISVEAIDWRQSCRHADRILAATPPLEWDPPINKWMHLPKTLDKLMRGGELRVVQLGDSIVNDMNNGNWDALVRRKWNDKVSFRVYTSVRGSTGCWKYRDKSFFRELVGVYVPDLLIIGGISNHPAEYTSNPIDDMREVIFQAREMPDCELILMSGPMGVDWRAPEKTNDKSYLSRNIPPKPVFYRDLELLAREMGIAFIDCYAIWNEYLAQSGAPWGWYHRDAVHANDRGKQILACILDRWLSPLGGRPDLQR